MAKRKQPEIQERLEHIVRAIDNIFEFTGEHLLEDFM